MTKKIKWVDLSLLGLVTVALLGLVLRSKILFALPFINYNHLLEAHSHFTFGGWITLSLLFLMVHEILPAQPGRKTVYEWLLGGIAICAWGMSIAFYLQGYSLLSTILSISFIILTYTFSWFFIRDIRKACPGKPVLWLAISSLVCLVLSSSGALIITYIFLTGGFDAFLYRDALFTYLHFQYNGFFSLAAWALVFHQLDRELPVQARHRIQRFTIVLCISIVPSLFLSWLWQDPSPWIRDIAIGGSLLVMTSFFLFIACIRSLRWLYLAETPVIRLLTTIFTGSFMLKIFLQGVTVFPVIGNAIFGNRPIIMGFLHLVFLGFVSLFILAFFTKKGWLDGSMGLTRAALTIFTLSVILNEAAIISQGFMTLFLPGSELFPWLLWIAGICLSGGSILIGLARYRTRKQR